MRDKSGQIMLVKIMMGILILVFAIIVFKPTEQTIDYATNSTELNCSDPSLNTVNEVTCDFLQVGLLFYYIATIIAVSLAVIQGKRTIFGVLETLVIFMVVVLLITPLKELIILFRDTSHLSCGAAGISLGANMLCIFVDLWLFYFVVISIALAASYVYNKYAGDPK